MKFQQALFISCIGISLAQDNEWQKRMEAELSDLKSQVKELANRNPMRSCHEYQEAGLTRDGFYRIDPDGVNFGEPSFMAHCDFATGATRIYHDSANPTRVPQCDALDCFQHKISYDTSLKQIINLMDLSETCTQSIKFGCYLAPLTDDGVNYGSWINRNGEKEIYFHGSNSGVHTCSCDSTGSCADPSDVCNCDSQIPEHLFDEGINDKVTH